jgi:phage terminase large subunit-like protein
MSKARGKSSSTGSQKSKRPQSQTELPPSRRSPLQTIDGRALRNSDLKSIPLDALEDLTDEEADLLLHTWELWARPNQLEPEGDWTTWLILAGRGFGKTRTGSETINKWVKSGKYGRIALVAEDSADARDVMVEGESGILACSTADTMPKYEPSKRRLTWPNGAVATLFSAEDYDSLRGPQFDAAWCDELCKWRYAQEAWDNLQFGLRLGDHPKQIVTTTPRPMKLLKDIILRSDTHVTRGNTRENLINLAPPFVTAVIAKYEGTRIGRQELEAEILDDVPGALWSRSLIEEMRLKPVNSIEPIRLPDFRRIVVAVDPAVSSGENSNETGIVVAAIDEFGRGYVLDDCSLMGSPDEWGKAVVMAYDKWGADMVVYETNQGGAMVSSVITSCALALKVAGMRTSDFVPMTGVHASRGKFTRAEPVSALYEQKRVRHVGFFATLEDQMCEYTPQVSMGYSPDRMDALVWALTYLMVGQVENQGLMEYYRQEQEKLQQKMSGNYKIPDAGTLIPLQAPMGVNTVYGVRGQKYNADNSGVVYVEEPDLVPLRKVGFKEIS